MCVSYEPLAREVIEEYFDTMPPDEIWPEVAWPHYRAPFIVSRDGRRETLIGEYGLVPKDKEPPIPPKPGEVRAPGDPIKRKSLSTVNARFESVDQRKYYRGPWSRSQRCLVPVSRFFEPFYATAASKPVWHGIHLESEDPFAVAGMWELWDAGTDRERYTFTQLTIAAGDDHFMSKFHKWGDEKRSLVILRPDQWDDWLTCSPTEAPQFLKLYQSELLASAPRQSRVTLSN